MREEFSGLKFDAISGLDLTRSRVIGSIDWVNSVKFDPRALPCGNFVLYLLPTMLKRFFLSTHHVPLSFNIVGHLQNDPRGNLCMGTPIYIISILDPSSWKQHSTQNGYDIYRRPSNVEISCRLVLQVPNDVQGKGNVMGAQEKTFEQGWQQVQKKVSARKCARVKLTELTRPIDPIARNRVKSRPEIASKFRPENSSCSYHTLPLMD